MRRRLKSSIAVSFAGMLTPFLLGAGLAWIFFYYTDLFPKKTSLIEAMLFLLPLFFTYSGLNTKIGLLNTGFLWLMCGAVLVAAVLGKGVACWPAARATGIPNREALGIGTLMNARGLMELIIINIGLQRGIISEGLFATLVIMAVITTLMASPLFERLVGSGTHQPVPEPEAEEAGGPKFGR